MDDKSNYAACIARIAARGSIGKKEAVDLLEAVAEAGEKQRRSGIEDPIATAAWGLARDLADKAEERKADALRNAGLRQDRMNEATTGGLKGAMSRLHSTLYWMPGMQFKGNVQSLMRSMSNDWLSVLHARLDKAGLVKAVSDRDMFLPVAKEIWKIRNGQAPSTGPAGQIAKVISDIQQAMRQRLNSEGARIKDANDWIATTSHDADLLRRGGRGQDPKPVYDDAYKAWRDYVTSRLDQKTFDDVIPKDGETDAQARERFLRNVYDGLTTGIHIKGQAEPTGTAPWFEGTSNIARKISQSRELLWAGPEAWAEYMNRYGNAQDWGDLMVKSASGNARRAALMHYWGTNPAGNLNLVMRRIEEQYRGTNPDHVIRFSKQKNSYRGLNIDDVMSRLDGRSALAANEMAAKIGTTARQFYNMVYLGAVGITHLSSLPATFTSEARFAGINAFSSLGSLMASLVKGLNSTERREVLEQLGAYGEGIARNAQNFFPNGGYDTMGVIAAMHSKFMKATVPPYIFDHAKSGMKEMIANKLGREISADFGSLERHLQNTLKGYGIDQPTWDLLKTGQLLKTPSNRVYLTPRIADSVDRGAIEQSLRASGTITKDMKPDAIDRAIHGFRRDLSDRLAMFYEDAADHAVVAPGVREQAFLQGRLAQGSIPSEMLHAIMQFKTWPLAALHQKLAREYYEGLGMGDKIWGIGLLTGLSMLGGYIRMTARDLAYGDQPRTPQSIGDTAKIAGAAVAQGGGLGLLGDFLFGEVNRLGTGIGGAMGGPIGTDAGRLYGIYNQAMGYVGNDKHAPSDVWPQLARFGVGHIPFANLFYLKSSFDYLVAYHLFEAMKPGWYRRTNEMMKKQQGRTMIGYKPYAPIPYLPPQLGLGG